VRRGVGRALARGLRFLQQEPVPRSAATAGLAAVVAVVVLIVHDALKIPAAAAETLFVLVHPLHVFLGALTAMRMLVRGGATPKLKAAAIGYALAIVIVTIADSLLPFLAELLLALPSRHVHFGFVEFWWIVHPMAIAGILLGLRASRVRQHRLPVLVISALPPLYDMMMAMWKPLDALTVVTVFFFAAVSVWFYLAGTAFATAWLTCRHGAGLALDRAIGRHLDEVQGQSRH
jgi:hypothetical protein